MSGESAVLELTLERFPTFESFEEGLKELATDRPLINLVNLENWLFPEGTKSMVVGFNYHRESIAEGCQAPLILWMTEPDIKTFAINAPDMWAWRSAVLDFGVEKAASSQKPVEETGLLEGIPLKAKVKRINEIKEFLANKPEDLSESLRADLLNELGLLFASLGKYEEALKYFKVSVEICKEIGVRKQEGTTLWNMGLLFKEKDRDRDKAIAYLMEALVIERELKNPNYEENRKFVEELKGNVAKEI